MSLEDWRQAFALMGIVLVLSSSAPLISRFLPQRTEPFVAMAVLGEGGMAEGYYPGGNPDITLGQPVKWQIYLYNHMGRAVYLLVKAKILDSASIPPNSSTALPSPAPAVYEFRRVMADNDTVVLPFEWSVAEARNQSGRLTIDRIAVNGHPLEAGLVVSEDGRLRFVFELWAYDENSNSFRFDLGDGSKCVWNQVWFNLKVSG